MTTPTDPAGTYAAAAALARELIKESNPTEASYRFGLGLASLFEALSDESERLGGLSPRLRQLGLDVAAGFLATYRDDQADAETIEQAAAAGNVLALSVRVMQTNESVSPVGSAPRALAGAYLDLFEHAMSPEAELDAELHGLLTRLAAAVVAMDQADAAEIGLDDGPGAIPIGKYLDGTDATWTPALDDLAGDECNSGIPRPRKVFTDAGRTGKSSLLPSMLLGLVEDLADQGVALVTFDGKTAAGAQVIGHLDEIRRGRDFARAAGVDVDDDSLRYRLRSGDGEPARVDVYDQGERVAIITEQPSKHGEHAEWHVGVIAPGAAKSASSISFARVVEHLDRFLGGDQ